MKSPYTDADGNEITPKLVPIKPLENSKLIAMLEEALTDAREGNITGAILITTFKEKEWRGQWTGLAFHSAIGYMNRLSYKINREWDEG